MGGRNGRDFLVGVNYWPAEHGVHWWEEFNPEPVARDLALMRSMGLNAVRLFLRWSDFQPQPDRLGEVALARFEQVLALARHYDLKLIPTLFTGHMSGENWDVSWRRDRCPYADADLLRAQLFFVRALASRYGRESGVLAWDLANEHDNFAPLPGASAGYIWAHLLTREFRHLAGQPVVLGTHVTSFTRSQTFRFPDLGQIHGELCVHPYPLYTPLCPGPPSLPPSTFFPSFCVKLAAGLGGRPVLMEEFGIPTTMVGEEEARRYYQVVPASALAAGATGALAWCFADFQATDRPPYATVPHEIGFGLTRNGRLKGSGEALAAFARLARRLPWGKLRPAPARAAILLPARYYDHPEEGFSPAALFGTLFAAYVLARQAGIEVDFLRPQAPLGRYRLLICPGVPRRGSLDLAHLRELAAFVRQGGCLYLSYAGVAWPELAEVFGLHLLYPDLGRGPAGLRPRLVVEPKGARIIKEAADGRPLALEHRYGRGYALFVTEPPEADLAAAPELLAQNSSFVLYRRAALAAGLDPRSWGADGPRLRRRAGGPKGEGRRGAAASAPEAEPAPGEAKLLLPRNPNGGESAYLVVIGHADGDLVWPNPRGYVLEDLESGEIFSGPVPLVGRQARFLRLLEFHPAQDVADALQGDL